MQENKVACGALFLCYDTNRVLLNLRAPHKSHNLSWSLWGGMLENNESPKDCLLRELTEEIGFVPDITKIYPFDIFESSDKLFKYYSFVCVVKKEFIPVLNSESSGYTWINLGVWPKPMHKGARITLCNKKSLEKLNLILMQHKDTCYEK